MADASDIITITNITLDASEQAHTIGTDVRSVVIQTVAASTLAMSSGGTAMTLPIVQTLELRDCNLSGRKIYIDGASGTVSILEFKGLGS